MQPAMKFQVLPLLCLVTLLGAASGLTVGPVRIVNERRYISYHLDASANNSLLECVFHLDDGEKVDRVFWEMWNDEDHPGTYEWRPGSGGNATGMLKGVVELNRGDGSLELTKLRYDLAGRYSCGVRLTSGLKKNTAEVEVLIVDTNGITKSAAKDTSCSCTASYESMAVFPEPTLRAGMYSPKSKVFYQEVSSHSWRKVIHYNGSVTYSYYNVSFEIDENTPDDIVHRVEMGVTKSDGEFILLSAISSLNPSWNEYGCPDIKVTYAKEVYYTGNILACRGGHRDRTKAIVACKDGFQPKGDVSTVLKRCNGTSLTWEPEPDHTATVEDLVCVTQPTDKPGGGASNGNPSLVLVSASLFGVVLLLFSHP